MDILTYLGNGDYYNVMIIKRVLYFITYCFYVIALYQDNYYYAQHKLMLYVPMNIRINSYY